MKCIRTVPDQIKLYIVKTDVCFEKCWLLNC